jgi:hypothetical protein
MQVGPFCRASADLRGAPPIHSLEGLPLPRLCACRRTSRIWTPPQACEVVFIFP